MIRRENRPFSEVLLEKFAFKSEGGGGVIELPEEAHQQLEKMLPFLWKHVQNATRLATTYQFPGDIKSVKEMVDGVNYYVTRDVPTVGGSWFVLGTNPVGELTFESPYTGEPLTVRIYFEYDGGGGNIGNAKFLGEGMHEITLNASQFINPTTLKSIMVHEIIHTIDPKSKLREQKGDEGLYVHPGPSEEEGIAYLSSPVEFDARVGELAEMLKGYFRATGKQFGVEEAHRQMSEFLTSLQAGSYEALESFFQGTEMFPTRTFLQAFFVYLKGKDENLKRQVLQKLYRAIEEVRAEISNY